MRINPLRRTLFMTRAEHDDGLDKIVARNADIVIERYGENGFDITINGHKFWFQAKRTEEAYLYDEEVDGLIELDEWIHPSERHDTKAPAGGAAA